MKRTERFSSPAVGGSSLLTIFAVLCLSVFALLSLSTAQAEKRMANASARAVSAYYEADTQAEEIFAKLRSGESVPGVGQTEDIYTYSCPISENQTLMVELEHTDSCWQIRRWQAVATVQTAEEENLSVWDGENLD